MAATLRFNGSGTPGNRKVSSIPSPPWADEARSLRPEDFAGIYPWLSPIYS